MALGWGVRRFHKMYMFSNPTEFGKNRKHRTCIPFHAVPFASKQSTPITSQLHYSYIVVTLQLRCWHTFGYITAFTLQVHQSVPSRAGLPTAWGGVVG